MLGIPSNWAGYYGLQASLAHVNNLKVGRFIHQIGNVHLYDNQIEAAKRILDMPQYPQPELYINPEVKYFHDFKPGDIKYINYQHGEAVRTDPAI